MGNRVIVMALSAVCAGAVAAQAASIPPSTVLANVARYDARTVTVAGSVLFDRPAISSVAFYVAPGRKAPSPPPPGKPYEVFVVCDSRSAGYDPAAAHCLRVFTWGHPSLREGQRVVVRGTFSRVKRVSGLAFQNEIEADSIGR